MIRGVYTAQVVTIVSADTDTASATIPISTDATFDVLRERTQRPSAPLSSRDQRASTPTREATVNLSVEIRRTLGRLWCVPWRSLRLRMEHRPTYAAWARYQLWAWLPGRGWRRLPRIGPTRGIVLAGYLERLRARKGWT